MRLVHIIIIIIIIGYKLEHFCCFDRIMRLVKQTSPLIRLPSLAGLSFPAVLERMFHRSKEMFLPNHGRSQRPMDQDSSWRL